MPVQERLENLRDDGLLKKYMLYSASTGLFIGVYYYSYYFSIQSPYSVQANLINYLWPTITPILAATLFKSSKPIGYRSVAALLISFIGCGIVITGFSISSFTFTIYHLSAFVAALSAGLYMNFAILAEDVIDDLPLIYMFALGVSTPFVILPAFVLPVTIAFTAETGLFILYVTAFTFVIANLSWTRSLIEGDTSRISALAYFIPIFSTALLALVSTPETPLVAVLVGGGLIVTGQIISRD